MTSLPIPDLEALAAVKRRSRVERKFTMAGEYAEPDPRRVVMERDYIALCNTVELFLRRAGE